MKKIILFLFYNFVKTVVEISYFIYFDKITFVNGERMRSGKPCIIAANHPNCLIDAMLVAKKSNRMVHFIANIGLFKSAFGNWFFTTFYTIPVQRYRDTGGKKINNQDSFNKCDEFLIGGGALFVAPQGTSWLERKLGELKTGTARIALSAASKQNFETELEIIPVGVTYEDALAFRKDALVQIGEPIKISAYKSAYEADPRTAVKKLTADLTEAMRILIIDAETDERDELLKKHEEILNDKNPLPLSTEFYRTENVLAALNELESTKENEFQNLEQKTNAYYEVLKANEINDKAVAKHSSFSVLKIFLFLIGFPFFLFGALNNLLSWGIPVIIKNKFDIYAGFDSSIKLFFALFTTPIFYGIQIFIVSRIFQNSFITWGYALLLIPMGIFAWWYYNQFSDFKKAWKLTRNRSLLENLTQQRKQLASEVESLLK